MEWSKRPGLEAAASEPAFANTADILRSYRGRQSIVTAPVEGSWRHVGGFLRVGGHAILSDADTLMPSPPRADLRHALSSEEKMNIQSPNEL